MDLASKIVDRNRIDFELRSQSLSLRFAPTLEERFENETALLRSRRLAIGGLVGLAIYDLLIASDWWLTPDAVMAALWIRFAIVSPIELISIVLLWRNPAAVWRETIIAVFGALAPTVTQLYIMLSSSSPFRQGQHEAVILVIIFAIMVQRLRFLFAVPTCIGCLIVYAYALHQLTEMPLQLQLSANIVFASAVVFSLFVSHHLERDIRTNYLLDLKNRMQNGILDAMSHQDALTGLQNRRSLDEKLDTCVHGDFVSVILVDIDHFKKINDEAGHQVGDLCLRSVSDSLRQGLKGQEESLFRYGGEEFLVLLPGVEIHEARAVAERLRVLVHGCKIAGPASPNHAVVTVSCGVAGGRPLSMSDMLEIVGGADAALYAAKRNGRNQVWPPALRLAQSADRIFRVD